MSERVVVTGASGFIAAHIIQQLLTEGYLVRGTVRGAPTKKEYDYLRALPGAADRLELVTADLTTPGAYDTVVQDAHVVMHTASPYVLDAKDPQKDLVDPAVNGTTSVLESCAKAPSVRRVIVTSSMAAITDEPESERELTESDWNDKSSLTRNAYYYSKTLAERAAWQFRDERKPKFDVVTINPFMVIGPSLSPGLNTSNKLFVDLMSGAYPGIMNLTWGFVDVRDVAAAHVLAAKTPGAEGRYICAADTVPMREIVQILGASATEKTKLPKLGMDCAAGDFMVRLSSYAQPQGVGSYLRTHVGRVPRYTNRKIQKDLGLQFRDVKKTVTETVADLRKWQHLG
jgi:dihydroflavonol-4-reductase